MYGYVSINRATLDEGQIARFRAAYCGLCHALRRRYGQISRLTLSYDMTVLGILLSSLYEEDDETERRRCGLHPLKACDVRRGECFDYAADMSVIIAWHKARDDWHDDRSVPHAALSRALRPHLEKVRVLYPDTVRLVDDAVSELTCLEAQSIADLDAAANCTGRILSQIYDMRGDFWSGALRTIGHALGRFIYIMDAYDDLNDDIKRGLPNPLKRMREKAGFDAEIYEILTEEMAVCSAAFEQLPLIRDTDLLRNVFYGGVWRRWAALHPDEQKGNQRKEYNDRSIQGAGRQPGRFTR